MHDGLDVVGEDELLDVAIIARPHGLQGEVRVHPYNPQTRLFDIVDRYFLRDRQHGLISLKLERQRKAFSRGRRGRPKGVFVVKFANVNDRTRAAELQGLVLKVRRADLPALDEDEFYHFEVLGYVVEDEHGRVVGTVKDVMTTNADIFVIRRQDDTECLIPAHERFVVGIDKRARKLFVQAVDELLDL